MSVSFDRAIAAARFAGDAEGVKHLEELRPKIRMDGEKDAAFQTLSRELGDQALRDCDAMGADPFDIMVVLISICARVIDGCSDRGLHGPAALAALRDALKEMGSI